MAWLNLYKAEQDVPIGYQSINQARDNLEYLRDSMLVQHAKGAYPVTTRTAGAGSYFHGGGTVLQPPWQVSPLKALGKHDDHRISRGVGYVAHGTPFYGTNYQPFLSWAGGQFTGVVSFGTGGYFLPVKSLTVFWATVTVYATSNTPKRFGIVRPYYPPSGSPNNPGIFVQIFDLVAGAFGPTNAIEFSVHLFGKSS